MHVQSEIGRGRVGGRGGGQGQWTAMARAGGLEGRQRACASSAGPWRSAVVRPGSRPPAQTPPAANKHSPQWMGRWMGQLTSRRLSSSRACGTRERPHHRRMRFQRTRSACMRLFRTSASHSRRSSNVGKLPWGDGIKKKQKKEIATQVSPAGGGGGCVALCR